MRRFFLLSCLVSILMSASSLEASNYAQGPFPTRSLNPLYQMFLVPRPERAVTLGQGQLRLSARGPFANLIERNSSTDTNFTIDLDMEIFRPNFVLEYGLGWGWEFGVEIPFLHMEGGFLDQAIQDYHEFFGFPNGGREQVSNGRFSYRVTQNGDVLFAANQETFGLSDLIFHAKKEFIREREAVPAVSGTFYIKVPTGDRGDALGSGNADMAFNLAIEKNSRWVHGYLNTGYVVLGATGLDLDPFLNSKLWTWMGAVEVSAWRNHLAVILQVQGDGSLFDDTGLSELDLINTMLTFGFAGNEGPWHWRAAFTEDLVPAGPAIDFGTFFEVGYTWGKI